MTQRPGYHTVTPYLVCRDASGAITWYAKHLGAQELYRLEMADGSIAHAEFQIGDSRFMISDEIVAMGILSPQSLGGAPVSLNLYVPDCDATFDAMTKDGAEPLFEVKDQFHGDRSGKLRDPFGHIWHISTNREPCDDAEIVKRFNAMVSGG